MSTMIININQHCRLHFIFCDVEIEFVASIRGRLFAAEDFFHDIV